LPLPGPLLPLPVPVPVLVLPVSSGLVSTPSVTVFEFVLPVADCVFVLVFSSSSSRGDASGDSSPLSSSSSLRNVALGWADGDASSLGDGAPFDGDGSAEADADALAVGSADTLAPKVASGDVDADADADGLAVAPAPPPWAMTTPTMASSPTVARPMLRSGVENRT